MSSRRKVDDVVAVTHGSVTVRKVVDHDGRELWQFDCRACGQTSALFSTRVLAEAEAWKGRKSHAQYRCPRKAAR